MSINDKIKNDILRHLRSINESTFDETTIKMLLMDIRDYSKGKNLVFEIANFIGHPERDQGLFKERIYSRYYRLERISREMMNIDFSKVDKSKTFDQIIWENRNTEELASIKRSVFEKIYILGLDDFYDETFQRSFKMNTIDAKKILASNYRLKNGYYHIRNNELRSKVLILIWFISTTVQFRSIIEQADFIAELENRIQGFENQFSLTDEYSKEICMKQNDIMIMILSLLHDVEYYHDKTKIGESYLSINKDDCLSLSCTVSVNDKEFTFPLVTTNITAKNYIKDAESIKKSDKVNGFFVERQIDGKLAIV